MRPYRREEKSLTGTSKRKRDKHARHSECVVATEYHIYSIHFLQDFEFIITNRNGDKREYFRCGSHIHNT